MIQSKKHSLYVQLLVLLVTAAGISVLVFGLLQFGGEFLIDNYLYQSNYGEQKNSQYIEKLQDYVTGNNIASKDAKKLYQWVQKQKIIYMQVFKDDIQVFDSAYPDEEVWDDRISAGDFDWEAYYSVRFCDGSAKVSIVGMYTYQFYHYAQIIELLIVFMIFLALVLWGIRRKMRYIVKLRDEIEILKSGSLDYPVEVQGKDEIAELARNLDEMRLALKNVMEQEEEISKENKKMLTEMSHDLRTPITSILLYTEILKKNPDLESEKQQHYMEKIEKKARNLKQLTDHLFQYSLVSGVEEIILEEPQNCELLFYDLFSEFCSYLEQNGLQVDFVVNWPQQRICISDAYMSRIMDNIASNILKYADRKEPVHIFEQQANDRIGFCFENIIAPEENSVESTGIGIQSIKNMMRKMHGDCEVNQKEAVYRLILWFPGE